MNSGNYDISKLGELRTVVYYSHGGGSKYATSKFYPRGIKASSLDEVRGDILETSISTKVLYYGSSVQFPHIDFSEYDFKFDIDKGKYNSDLKIINASEKTRELVGKDVEELEKLEKVIFPTLSTQDIENSYEYFGSMKINNQLLYLLEAGEYINKIEVYEEIIDKNCELGFVDYDILKQIEGDHEFKEPKYCIYLGPLYEDARNTEEMYYDGYLPNPDTTSTITSESEWKKLNEEITGSKIIWIYITSDSESVSSSVNISSSSWRLDINPARNKNRVTLRNDDFYKGLKETRNIMEENGYYFDAASKTMLGVVSNNESGFLNYLRGKKLEKKYSPNVTYSKLDEVEFKGEVYLSVTDNNIGNYPSITSNWILKSSYLLEGDVNGIVVSIYPEESKCDVNPGSVFLNDNTKTDIEFSIIEAGEYEFSKIYLSDEVELSREFYRVESGYEDTSEGDTIEVKYVIISYEAIEKIKEAGGNLIFIFEKVKCTTTFNIYYDDTLGYVSIGVGNFSDFKLNSIETAEGVIPFEYSNANSKGTIIAETFNKEVTFNLVGLDKRYNIGEIYITYIKDGRFYKDSLINSIVESDFGETTKLSIKLNEEQSKYKSATIEMKPVVSNTLIEIDQTPGIQFSKEGYILYDRGSDISDIYFCLDDKLLPSDYYLEITSLIDNEVICLELLEESEGVIKDTKFIINLYNGFQIYIKNSQGEYNLRVIKK